MSERAIVQTFQFRLRDKHAADLQRQARAVNFVWNYCNETQQKAVREGRKWLSAVELQRLTAGSSKLLSVHSQTIQKVCQQYDRSRTAKRRPWLRWRSKKSLGWVPFNQGTVAISAEGRLRFRSVDYETMHWRSIPEGAVMPVREEP